MAYFHCLIGGGSSGGGLTLTVTCDSQFAGTTITCTDGTTTLTSTCPSASPYEVEFEIPNGGTWTVSGTISGSTFTASIDIPEELELHSTPDGSTVTPTDDIQTWLACGGITDKSYTTLNEVLADSTTLLALISDDNASDYLVRSTTWASGITADSTAMTDIGANDYCANTLRADSTWLAAIGNSSYFESVLNIKAPTMTDNTTPSGTCSGSSNYPNANSDYYKPFDGNANTSWVPQPGVANGYIQYEFATAIIVNKIFFKALNTYTDESTITTLEVKCGNTESSLETVATYHPNAKAFELDESFVNSVSGTICRIALTYNDGSKYVQIPTIQIYGR